MQHVFVYGTLLFSDILKGLTLHSFKCRRAILCDYKRLAVKDCDYPAIIPYHNLKVEGKLIFDIDHDALEIISFFEGDKYEKITVEIQLGNEKVKAFAFVWRESSDRLKKTE